VGGRRSTWAALVAALVFGCAAGTASAAARLPGVDVSRFQEQIDWEAVAATGVRFAFVHASRGSGADCTVRPQRCGPDGFYDANYAEAKAAGIRVGPYHRAFAGGNGPRAVKADAKAEAKAFIDSVGELRQGDLRPALDMEVPFGDLSPFELRVWARTWLEKVGRAFHTTPIIYTNTSSWDFLADPISFARAGHPLWVANWHVPRPAVPAADWAGESWRVWQHASDGSVDGITGPVDLDWLRGGWHGVSMPRGGGGVSPGG
jgi:lysozyme